MGEHVGVHHQPAGAAFDIVLLLHVACAVAGLVTTLAAAATATRLRHLLRASAPLPDPLRRYFRPGVNWAGRSVYGIPVFGFALLAMSRGAYALGDGWVLGGVASSSRWPSWPRACCGRPSAGSRSPSARSARGPHRPGADGTERAATVMVRAATAALVLLVAGMVVMVVQP